MKKVIALVIAIVMVLSGCTGKNTEMNRLRQEVERLQQVETENAEIKQEVERLQQVDNENAELRKEVERLQKVEVENSELQQEVEELSKLKEEIDKSQENDDSDESTAESSNTTETKTNDSVTEDMLNYLTAQLQSDNYGDWNEVAKCKYATEQHLLEAAKKCTGITGSNWAVTIAGSICSNPAATGKVIKELANSWYYKAWDIAAQSKYADEESSIAIAKKCASITDEDSIGWADAIAHSICSNSATTGKAIKELTGSKFYLVWNIAAQSKYADEESLITIAKKCASITDDEEWATIIAQSIRWNPATTSKVLIELVNSKYSNLRNIGHKAIESMQ